MNNLREAGLRQIVPGVCSHYPGLSIAALNKELEFAREPIGWKGALRLSYAQQNVHRRSFRRKSSNEAFTVKAQIPPIHKYLITT